MPYGAIGEIYISGDGLSGYYINRPDLTERAYLKNKEGVLVYKTGDIGRYNFDSEIEFLGRKDQQIKIRGFRIEIDEIEKSINESAMVSEAIVVVESSDTSDFSFENIENSDVNTLASLMNNHLSEQEIVSLFQSVESLSSKEKEYLLDQMVK